MRIIRFLGIFGIPMVLGTVGFLLAGEELLQSMFQAVQLFLFEFGDPPANVFIEIARWLAPLATATGVLMAFSEMRAKLQNYLIYRKGNSTAVYGPEEEKQEILERLKGRVINGGATFVRAHRYILLGEEEENLSFYKQNYDQLKDALVYLKCESLPAQSSADANLRLYCPEEIAARLYWKRFCLYENSRAMEHRMDVAVIGFGKLGEELLEFALQNNVFAAHQQITYHIFGKSNGYMETHRGLQYMQDRVCFHSEPWYEQVALLEQAGRVIVLEQNNQLRLLRDLLLCLRRKEIDVFADHVFGAKLISEKNRLRIFDWKTEAGKPEHILGDVLYDRAKRINMRYVKKYDSTGSFVENEENKQKEWAKLSTFHRYSNIRSADYHEIQREMLKVEGIAQDFDQINQEWKERLSVLEHISWCNYHYMNNWEYGEKKDSELRTHPDLILFDDLNDVEKGKDLSNIELLFSC